MEEQDDDWVEQFCNSPYVPKRKPARRKTPHSILRAAARKLLKTIERTGNAVLIVPQFSGRVSAGEREFNVGRPGTADDLAVVCGRVYGLEYKAGQDRQRATQQRWQELFERAGGTYVIVRKPADALDAIVQDLAQRGKIF
jgi:hypothetical protein